MQRSKGLNPVARPDARVLVLGSLPGQRSLRDQEYYAHPQNAFWPIMKEIFAIGGNYVERCSGLISHKVALWDVLEASVRPGSLDADIRTKTATANDFGAFLDNCPNIELIVFNGKKAEQLFGRLVLAELLQKIDQAGLPSTSPAYAAMSFQGKLDAWKAGLKSLQSSNKRRAE